MRGKNTRGIKPKGESASRKVCEGERVQKGGKSERGKRCGEKSMKGKVRQENV